MPALTDLTGLAGAGAALAVALLALPGVARLRQAHPAALLLAAASAALVPVAGLPAAGYLRGVVGDLSLTTLLLLLRSLLRPVCGWNRVETRSLVVLQVLVVAGGLALYPPALGLGGLDPYPLGYASLGLLGGLLLVTLVAWLRGLQLVAACIALAVLAWAAGACESRNVWDYLIDPFLSAYGLGALLLRGAARGMRRLPGERREPGCA